MKPRPLRFETIAVHAGEEPNLDLGGTGDVVSPIQLSSTFAKKSVRESGHGFSYSRTANPTRSRLEARLAALHDAKYAIATPNGTAAAATICLSLLEPGDRIVASNGIYGGTKVFFDDLLAQYQVTTEFVDATSVSTVEDAVTDETALVWMETPTNPLLELCDIQAISDIAEEYGAPLVVDNTFASPYFQRPLELGADVVLYSVTKFLNGHTDITGGAVVLNDEYLFERFHYTQTHHIGSTLSPFDCYLALRGIKTLPLRMEKHQENSLQIASFLEDHEKVDTVHYPGLESHPQHVLANEQMDGYGGVLSFEIDGDGNDAVTMMESLDVFSIAVSLGGVESLIDHPVSMSSSYVPEEKRELSGITESLIRAPIGIEDAGDLINDLEQALATI